MKLKSKKVKLKVETEDAGLEIKTNLEPRTSNTEQRMGEGNVQSQAAADGTNRTDGTEGTDEAGAGSAAPSGAGVQGVMMKKVRSDALWNKLSGKQREMLEEWLFEDRLNYDVALERAQKELGYTGSRTSLRRFYARTAEERMLRDLTQSREQVDQIRDTPVSAEELRAAGMKVVAQLFLRQVTQAPEQVKEWSRLAKLLLQSESNEIRFRLKREENELRRKAMDFAREKFHYDIMEEGKKVLPELQKAWEAGLTQYERNARTNNLRRHMWGREDLPDLLPENEEQEKQMAAQKIIDEAARAKQHEWWYKTFGSPEAKARIAAEREADRQKAYLAEEEPEREAQETETKTGPKTVIERGVVYPYGQ